MNKEDRFWNVEYVKGTTATSDADLSASSIFCKNISNSFQCKTTSQKPFLLQPLCRIIQYQKIDLQL